MRVYEAKIVYSLISLGEEVRLDKPPKVADYLRSAFEENPDAGSVLLRLSRPQESSPWSPAHHAGHSHFNAGFSKGSVPRVPFSQEQVAIVVAHNHPSGDPGPSQADITVTRALREAARILEIVVPINASHQ